jgi:hypothetical protein
LGLGVLYPPVQILGVWRHVARSEPCLVHPKTDRLDGIWLTRRRPCALLVVSILYASEVQILSIVKYASMPSGEQTRDMRSMSAHVACRLVFNKALALHDETYRNAGSSLDSSRWRSTSLHGASCPILLG